MQIIKDHIERYRKFLIIVAHVFLICAAYITAFYFRFEFNLPGEYILLILRTLPVLIIIKVLVFAYFRLFSGLWRYVSMDDLWRIVKANITATLIFIVFESFTFRLKGFPRSIFIFDWVLCVGFISGIRFVSRGIRERFRPARQQRSVKTLIVGAGEAGIMILRELKNNARYDIAGFIDDDPSKKGMLVHGKRVLGDKEKIASLVAHYGVEEIVIAIPSARGEVIRDIISCCQFPNIKVKIIPGMYKILNGDLEIKMREVKPDDLLGRETVGINEDEIRNYVENKVVLITGAGGSIGSELTRQIAQFSPKQIVLVDYNENDIYFLENEFKVRNGIHFDLKTVIADVRDIGVLKHVFSRHRPQIVFHAAAFKHVPLMEEHPASAVKNNVIASRNLIYASDHYGVESFVLISSDKAVNPTSVMGATKRISEMILQAKATKSKTRFIAVRFGNVLGSKGSVVPLFKKQIEEDGKVTVTHPEARRFFMSVNEAVRLVLQASTIGKGGEIFILDMGEQIKIVELAKNLITLSGLKPEEDIPIKFIGLRPGEKLYEETLRDAERDQATKYEKIFIVQPEDFDSKKLHRKIKELERLAQIMDNGEILEKIKDLVPAYIPTKI